MGQGCGESFRVIRLFPSRSTTTERRHNGERLKKESRLTKRAERRRKRRRERSGIRKEAEGFSFVIIIIADYVIPVT